MGLILENFKIAGGQNLRVVVARMNPSIVQGFRKDENKINYIEDADSFVCPAGHLAIRKAGEATKYVGPNRVDTYYFDI